MCVYTTLCAIVTNLDQVQVCTLLCVAEYSVMNSDQVQVHVYITLCGRI